MADLAHPEAEAAERSPTYEQDGYGWALHQARLIREGRLDEVDVENVAEEIESVGRRERSELGNRLAILMQHLLKWTLQPDRRGASWEITIDGQRADAEKLLADNPSLQPRLHELVAAAYPYAVRAARRETGLQRSAFPATCPYSLQQLFDEDFLPD